MTKKKKIFKKSAKAWGMLWAMCYLKGFKPDKLFIQLVPSFEQEGGQILKEVTDEIMN